MSTKDPIRRRTRFGAITVIAAAGSVALAGPAFAGEVALGRNLEMNPSIDYVLFEFPPAPSPGAPSPGFVAPGTMVRLDVYRGETLIASKTTPVTDAGNVEVNHGGPLAGDCWDDNETSTPDLRGGDRLQATVLGTPGDVNFMFARVINFREQPNPTPPTRTLIGTAFGNDEGSRTAPLSLAGAAAFGAKRVVEPVVTKAIESIDPEGNWSVELPGEGGEVSVDWIETAEVGGGDETTTAFPGADEPGGPCGPVRQSALSTNSHPVINLTNVGTDVVVGGPEAGPEKVTTVNLGGKPGVVAHNDNGTWTATIASAAIADLVDGEHTLTANFVDPADPSTAKTDTRPIVKDTIAPTLNASLPPGAYSGNQTTSLTSDATGIKYTLDGNAPTPDFGADYTGVPITLSQGGVRVLRARVADANDNVTTLGPLSYDIQNPPATNDTGGTQTAGGTAGTATGSTTPPAGLTGAFTGSSILGLARLRPGVVSVASKARLRTVRRFGLGLKVGLPAGATLMQVRIARRINGRDRAVQTVTVPVTKAGTLVTRLAAPKLRAKFRPGTYVLRIATGRSASTLGAAVIKKVRIVR